MQILTPKFRYDPNAKVRSAYVGVADGHRTVTRITHANQHIGGLARHSDFGAGIPRGQGGRAATIMARMPSAELP